jgi:hypothetical protein
MSKLQDRDARTAELIGRFPRLVARYDDITPFTQSGQLELHRQTIALRNDHPTPSRALSDR